MALPTASARRHLPESRISVTIQRPADAAWMLSQVAVAEQIRSTDQHEWLRLMLGAEWYR
jgi:hypothetical protein